MSLPFGLPDWMPGWAAAALLAVAAVYLLLFLLMPFSVFGVKARLDTIEARIDELHADLRSLTLRLPERAGRADEATGDPGFHDPPPPVPPRRRPDTRPDTRPEPRVEPRLQPRPDPPRPAWRGDDMRDSR